jgi:hypothetical protein
MASFKPKSETIQGNRASSLAFLPLGANGVADKSKATQNSSCSVDTV